MQGIISWLKTAVSALQASPPEMQFISAIAIAYSLFRTSLLECLKSHTITINLLLNMFQHYKLNFVVLCKMASKETRLCVV